MALETETIRRYLLGDISEAEREDLAMSISDHDFDRDIEAAENELIEEYLEGTLSKEHKELFESHYLSSGEHRDLVHELALLKRYSSGPAQVYLTGEMPVINEGLSQYRPLAAAAVVVVLGFLGLLSWMMFSVEQLPPLEQKYVELNSGNLGDLSQYPSMVLVRESEIQPAHEPKFATNGPGTSFLFRLPVNAADENGYDAAVSINGGEAFKIRGLHSYKSDGTSEVRLLLPREIIATGRVVVTLTSKGRGESAVFPFIAE
jgi:hypothetical protein